MADWRGTSLYSPLLERVPGRSTRNARGSVSSSSGDSSSTGSPSIAVRTCAPSSSIVKLAATRSSQWRGSQPGGRPELELARVEALPLAEREEVDVVAVAPDQEDAHDRLLAVHAQTQPVAVPCRLHDRPHAREGLVATPVVLAPVHEAGVDAERDVVEEDAVADLADVDLSLDRIVVEGRQRAERIVAVEADVSGEVVPRSERNADEGRVGLERDRGDLPRGSRRRPRCPARRRRRRVRAPPDRLPRRGGASRYRAPAAARTSSSGARVSVARPRIDQKEALQAGPTVAATVGPRDRNDEPNGP